MLAATAAATPAPAVVAAPPPHAASAAQDNDTLVLTPEQNAQQDAYEAYRRSLLKALRESPIPRDRALAANLALFDPAAEDAMARVGPRLLRDAARAAPDDVLVQWLWATANDARTGCDARDPCPRRAEAVARLQPDNGAAWMPVIEKAWQAHDVPAAEAALANSAVASRFEQPMAMMIRAWMDIHDRHPLPPTLLLKDESGHPIDPEAAAFTDGFANAVSMSMTTTSAPLAMCHRDRRPDATASRLRNCAQLGRLMMGKGNTLLDRNLGRVLLRFSGQATADDMALARVVDWQYEQNGVLLQREGARLQQAAKEEAAHTDQMLSDWLASSDEIEVLHRQMERAGIPLTPPAGWQPTKDGKPVDPLGEAPVAAKHGQGVR